MRVFRFCYGKDDNVRYGNGIYQDGGSTLVSTAADVAGYEGDGESHPTPYRDPGLGNFFFNEDWYCACENLESLCRWFYGYKGVEHLLNAGAFVEEWDTHYYRVGRFQVIFKRGESTIVRHVPREEILAIARGMSSYEETTKKELTETARKINMISETVYVGDWG